MTGVLGSPLGGDGPSALRCSRSGCEDVADVAIRWRNPKIHAPDRRKTWLACAEHTAYLREFLAARAFPLEVLPVADVAGAS